MFDHIMLRTAQFDVMTAFYEQALAPLGIKKLMAFESAAGFGRDAPVLMDQRIEPAEVERPSGAVESGPGRCPRVSRRGAQGRGKDNGAPGPRDFAPNYYAAFVIDPDGNNIEAASRAP